MIQPDLRSVSARQGRAISEAVSDASVSGFRLGVGASAVFVVLAGLLGLGLRNPRRAVAARQCPGGQLVGAPLDAARRPEEVLLPAGHAATAPAG